jgi:hypothetical protein
MKDLIARNELLFVTRGVLVGQFAQLCCCNPDMLNFHED